MLIKGVNKRIIEVLNPEDECFERIILFLNPNCSLDEQLLSRKTGEYVQNVSRRIRRKRTLKRGWKLAGQVAGAIALGGMAAVIVNSVF